MIVDWHAHEAQNNQAQAVAFFSDLARRYGHLPNVIWEPYNEPLQVSWTGVIKPYHQAVVSAIRAADPDNIIVLGTPTWSQDVDVAAAEPGHRHQPDVHAALLLLHARRVAARQG